MQRLSRRNSHAQHAAGKTPSSTSSVLVKLPGEREENEKERGEQNEKLRRKAEGKEEKETGWTER